MDVKNVGRAVRGFRNIALLCHISKNKHYKVKATMLPTYRQRKTVVVCNTRHKNEMEIKE